MTSKAAANLGQSHTGHRAMSKTQRPQTVSTSAVVAQRLLYPVKEAARLLGALLSSYMDPSL
jgi:hypothetical protein